jgi:hypothetical protein
LIQADADPQQLAMLGINPPTASLLLDEDEDDFPNETSSAGESFGMARRAQRWFGGYQGPIEAISQL